MENVNKNKETDFIQNILFCYKYVSSHYIFFFMPLDDRLDQQIQRDCDQTIFKHLEITLEQRQFFKVFLVVRVNHVLSGSVVSDSLQLHGLQPARLLCPWGFSKKEYWSQLPCPPPGDLPNPGIEPRSPTLQADALPSERIAPAYIVLYTTLYTILYIIPQYYTTIQNGELQSISCSKP